MSETRNNAIDFLPGMLSQNAQSMMRRMVLAMQEEMAQDRQLANSSYCALLLKLSEPDLVREFDVAIKSAMTAIKKGSNHAEIFTANLSLSLEPVDDAVDSSINDFASSAALFDQLCSVELEHKIESVEAFSKDVFLAALKDAFLKSRIDNTEAAKIMPYARRALNAELVELYGKLGGR